MSTSQRPPGRARVQTFIYHESSAQIRSSQVLSRRSPICAAASSASSPGRRTQGAPRPPAGTGEPTPANTAGPRPTVSRRRRRIIGCEVPSRGEHRPRARTARREQTVSLRRTLRASRRKDPPRHPKIGMDRPIPRCRIPLASSAWGRRRPYIRDAQPRS